MTTKDVISLLDRYTGKLRLIACKVAQLDIPFSDKSHSWNSIELAIECLESSSRSLYGSLPTIQREPLLNFSEDKLEDELIEELFSSDDSFDCYEEEVISPGEDPPYPSICHDIDCFSPSEDDFPGLF